MIEIKLFQQDDWNIVLDIANQAVPFAPHGNIEWLEKRKAFDESSSIRRHYIATKNDIPVGYSCIEQQGNDLNWLRIFVVCSPEKLRSKVGQLLFEKVLQDAKELRVEHLWAREYQDDEAIRAFFLERGFVEVRRINIPNELPMVVYQMEIMLQSANR
jgi:N-acetylglutamate synthase-like GNAT family acetyltransferase